MVSGPSAQNPTAPTYTQPASYLSEPSTSSLQSLLGGNVSNPYNPVAITPFASAGTIGNKAATLESKLPPGLSLWGNPVVAPGAQQNYSNQFYNTDIAPGIASQQTAEQQSGMLNSSAGGAELGQMQAQGRAQQTLQGQQYYTNALNNLLNERSNYYGTAIQGAFDVAQGQQNTVNQQLQQAQNQAQDSLGASAINSQLNQALAGFAFQTPQLQNAFNLTTNQNQNNFAQQNYQTGASIYGNQLSADQAAARTNAGLLGKGGGGSLSGSLTGLNALATP